MSDSQTQRTEEQIQAELAAVRAQMSQTVDALVGRMQPENLLAQAKIAAAGKVEDAKAFVSRTVADARDGDPEALKRVGIAAGCAAAVVGLVLLRLGRRGR